MFCFKVLLIITTCICSTTVAYPRPDGIFNLPPLLAFDGSLSPAGNVYTEPKIVYVIKRGFQINKQEESSWIRETNRQPESFLGYNYEKRWR